MKSVIEQETRRQVRFLRLPEVLARTGLVAEHDLRAAGPGALPASGLAGCSRGRLDRGRGGRVDPGADRREPDRRLPSEVVAVDRIARGKSNGL